MYYDRTISKEFEHLLTPKTGSLGWLIDYVKGHADLDILIGKNNKDEYCSVYRGISKLITITTRKGKNLFQPTAADSYIGICPELYKDISSVTEVALERLRIEVEKDPKFNRYYNNQKEGYYQNLFSREFGILSDNASKFVIVDKEVVVGYENEAEKNSIFTPLQKKYKEIRSELSKSNEKKFGRIDSCTSLGSELDLLALDEEGNIILMEVKHGSNTHGIYLSPFQIGLYYEVFNAFGINELFKSVKKMAEQKQRLGLISSEWRIPESTGKLRPELVIAEPNDQSQAMPRFDEVTSFIEQKGLSLPIPISIRKI